MRPSPLDTAVRLTANELCAWAAVRQTNAMTGVVSRPSQRARSQIGAQTPKSDGAGDVLLYLAPR